MIDEKEHAGEPDEHDGDERPCAHCGRPVPQRNAAGRPFRYCRDNDGECQKAARNARLRHRSSPGLSGQVARAFEVAERLDQVVESLVEALHTELSPLGVERQVAQARAEAATGIVTAHAERDDARTAAEQARAATRAAQAAAEASRAEAAAAHEDADRARQETAAAHRDTATARQAAETAAAEAAVLVAEARHTAEQSVAAAERSAAARVTAAETTAAEQLAAAQETAARQVTAAETAAAQQVAAAEQVARDTDAAATVAGVERDAARREAATEAALRAEAYRERDTARTAAATAATDRETVQRSLLSRTEETDRLRRRLEAAQAATHQLQDDNTRLQDHLRRLEGEVELARSRAEDLRTQLARAAEREVTTQAHVQQQLATLTGALAQLTGSRQPAVPPAETTTGETRHGGAKLVDH